MIEFDWSRQYIVEFIPILLEIQKQSDGIFSIVWKDKSNAGIHLRASITGSKLLFDIEYAQKNNLYVSHKYANIGFASATLNIEKYLQKTYMSGEVNTLSLDTQEPGKQLFIDLIKIETSESSNITKNMSIDDKLVVCPSIFTTKLFIRLHSKKKGIGELRVRNINGKLLSYQRLDTLKIGSNDLVMPIKAPKGAYLISVQVGDNISTSLVVKN